jgi:hypothetical protein
MLQDIRYVPVHSPNGKLLFALCGTTPESCDALAGYRKSPTGWHLLTEKQVRTLISEIQSSAAVTKRDAT